MIEQFAAATDEALLAEVVELENELSRVQYRQLAVLAELNSRNVPGTLGFRGLASSPISIRTVRAGRAAAAAGPSPARSAASARLDTSLAKGWWSAVASPSTAGPTSPTHDAFEEAGRRLLATSDLPHHAGLPSQLIITMSLTDLERRAGRATTHHGGTLSIDDALRLAADGHLLPMILADNGAILGHGRKRRLATPPLRTATFARDRGCTFPGCARTAAQSELHHATDWANGGTTDLDNLAIACGYHNKRTPARLDNRDDRRHPALATTTPAPTAEASVTTCILQSCSEHHRNSDGSVESCPRQR